MTHRVAQLIKILNLTALPPGVAHGLEDRLEAGPESGDFPFTFSSMAHDHRMSTKCGQDPEGGIKGFNPSWSVRY